jgi:transcriptional regulator with XRE-family HTH domain
MAKRSAKPPPSPAAAGDLTAIVGTNLKRARSERGLSLAELAQRSGVSRSMLNQIERGQSAPTINVLFRIAQALDLPFSDLLADARASGPRVLRAHQIRSVTSRDGQFVSRALFTFDGQRKAEVYELHLAPGGARHAEPHSPFTRESLTVSRGALDLTIAGEDHHLGTGDAIIFDADVAHSYRNRGRTELVMFLVMTYRSHE